MRTPAVITTLLIGALCVAAPLSAAPRASISGKAEVGSTLTVRVSGGKASAIRWEQCATRVRANRCARVTRIGRGRTLVLPAASRGKSVRAVMRVKGRQVRTRFSAPVAAASGGGGGTAPTTRLVIPAGWQVTGSESTIPFAAGTTQAQKDQTIAQLNVAYPAIAAQVQGGRILFFSESLGNGGLITEITLNLCTAGTTFSRRVEQSGLGGGTTQTVNGTWVMTLDLTQGVVPALVLTDAAGTALRDTVDLVDASRVKLGDKTYTTGPSTTCG